MPNKNRSKMIREQKDEIKREIIKTVAKLREREKNGEIGIGINRTINELAEKYLINPATIYLWCRKESISEKKKREVELARHTANKSEKERQKYVWEVKGRVCGRIDKLLAKLNEDEKEMFAVIMKDRYGKDLNEKEKTIISLAESALKEIKEEEKKKEISAIWDEASPKVKEDSKDVKARVAKEGDIAGTFRVEVKGEIVGKDLTEEEAEKLSDEWEEKGFDRIKDVDILEE